MENLYILDATGYIFRSYYAIRNMTNAKGESTGALFGFIRTTLKLLEDFKTKHIVAVFDGPKNKVKRLEIYKDYKANRSAPPEDLPRQINKAKEFCLFEGIPTLEIEGVEADDVIGSVVKWAKDKVENKIFICSADKDLAQLVDEKTVLVQPHKENALLDTKGVLSTFGIRPDQIVDYLTIIGDTSDNVPGIPGIGPKTAVSLLSEFETLENIFKNIEKIPGKKKQEALTENQKQAFISRQLVSLFEDEEIPKKQSFYFKAPPKTEDLIAFFKEENFKSLFEKMEAPISNEPEKGVDYHLIESFEELETLLSDLTQDPKPICVDTETTDLHPLQAGLVGIGLSNAPKKGWYVPFNGKLDKKKLKEKFAFFLNDSHNAFFGHNIKYDLHVLKKGGMPVKHVCFDTMIASYLLRSHFHRHSLDELAKEYFGKEKTPISALIGKGKKAISMDQVPLQQVADYCCEDVDYTTRLYEVLKKELPERNLEALFEDLEMPLLKVLQEMEEKGIFLDVHVLEKQSHEVEKDLKILEKQIYSLAGEEFNINSPKQLSDILFQKLKLPTPKKTSTGFSTNADVLEKLQADHPIAEKILEYRKLEKLRSSYLASLPQEINPETGRIHCTFNQSVAATGRLSCQNPNLQTIPVRTEVGKRIRLAFRPEKPGWSYLSADYSQIELRLLAHLSKDDTLIQAFKEGQDIHKATAALVFGVPIDQVTKKQRHHAKAVNFGIMYGQQAFGLAREIKTSVKEASEFIKKYFETYPKIYSFLETIKEKARREGKAVSMKGRERLLPDINSKNPVIRSQAERFAINSPIQGTQSDLIKEAMIRISKKIKEKALGGYCILQIHDELIFEIPDKEIDLFSDLVRNEMEKVEKLEVPLVVDISIGKNWKEC